MPAAAGPESNAADPTRSLAGPQALGVPPACPTLPVGVIAIFLETADIETMVEAAEMTVIPVVDLGDAAPGALAVTHAGHAAALVRAAKKMLPGPILPVLDWFSRRWAHKSGNPYISEVSDLAARIGTGAWFMNFCFEWGCTTGVAADPRGTGTRMLRTLDWPFHGIGRHVVVARQSGPAGHFLNITWPGFVGVITALAPGRFALAINQAPLVRRGYLPLPLDWIVNRIKVFQSPHLPPAHLARRVMETCRTYQEAREMLETTPLALPAFFTLAGTRSGEGCVIERMEDRAWIHAAPAAVANHWLTRGLLGRPRGIDSRRRHRLMNGLARLPTEEFGWMLHPIHNPETRLSVEAYAATGRLVVQGWEADGAATEVLTHEERAATAA